MHKKKRGQVTVYIIIGIVILFLAILLFYLKGTTEKEMGIQELVRAQKIPREVRPITNYVTINLDDATKKGLLLIGRQGGYIYESQGDLTPGNTKTILYNEHNVSYGIYKQTSNHPFFYWYKPPYYPWKYFPKYPNKEILFYGFFNIFGINNLPPLDGPDPYSIESQLEYYITNYLKENINLTIFDEQGFEIDDDVNKINVSVVIGENDVTVFLEYPLGINKTITNTITNVSYFYTNPQVRLRKVYNLIDDIISKEIVDISFDVIDIEILDNYINDMTIEKRENVYKHDDIIIIRDNRSMLYAQPYTFQFARENRYPALHYIFLSVTTIDISNLEADDPDEDILSFNYFPPIIYVSDGELEDYQDLGII